MPTLDWIFLAVLLFSLVLGAWRGLVYEVLSLLSWAVAFVLAQWFAMDAAQWIPISGDAEAVRYAGGFVLVFVATVFAGGLIAFVVKKLVAAAGMSPADRMLGAIFGLVRGMLLLLVVTAVVGMTPVHTANWWQSAMGPRMAGMVLSSVKPLLPEEFGKYLP
ncbi:colicin V synthesis protein [Rhodoferax sp. TH121]|uniref:CvpA family protein n=1 Tax=Rhodoferax sp. TH121 TaxID=2022803 RepID=UPI000B974A72|nr:CvpA family protein [Rhodoferax sp. TH121]OYQ41917.1 colicin V synthesis protein [Rhodoferax sp. TH121]